MKTTTSDVLKMSPLEVLSRADKLVREDIGYFIREFNKREWSVRIAKIYPTFQDYVDRGYIHDDRFGLGFVVEGAPVPYFHPNRSFHDEIIWLNKNLYYDREVSFTNKLLNSAVVKFYGPSRTVDIITGNADIPYLTNTGTKYVDFNRILYLGDTKYEIDVMNNVDLAFANGEKIWGTTELRTSLMGASRDYARKKPSIIDKVHGGWSDSRPMRPSDMIHWISAMGYWYEGNGSYQRGLVDYCKTMKPTMKDSYEYLTSYRGIGPYYGYHFSSNLARMPGIGSSSLIDAEFSREFAALNIDHGNLDEDADYVVAGPGACKTLSMLFPDTPINNKTSMHLILCIRNLQNAFFGIQSDDALRHMLEATELGRFTTFGTEIALCQYSVFARLRDDKYMAINRSRAPISTEAGRGSGSDLSEFIR